MSVSLHLLSRLPAQAFRRLFRIPKAAGVRSMSSQLTNRVMMVRPSLFKANQQTVSDNIFQSEQESMSGTWLLWKNLTFFAELIKQEGIHVSIVQDTKSLPDAVYPNNWISFHSKDEKPIIAIYPMMSACRREERRSDIIQSWVCKLGAKVIDYSKYERDGLYLEGTGSMVLDRTNGITYACLSQRTNMGLLKQFCNDFNSKLVSFNAYGTFKGSLSPIYHTNVMMCVGTTFAVVCVDSITNITERKQVCDSLSNSGKTIIPISAQQMWSFAGNMLQLQSTRGHTVLAMSTQAYRSLNDEQLEAFREHSCVVVHGELGTLEKYGGGSARCMIAEVFPPLKQE